MPEFVTVRHPDVEKEAVVARSALKHLDPGWQIVEEATLVAGAAPSTASEFDPSGHTVDEVKAYLVQHPEDTERVVAAEQSGQARKGIVEQS